MDRIRVGIAGAGLMGWTHFNTLRAMGDVDIVGVCSRNDENAKQMASTIGCRYFSGIGELLRSEVEAVWVCTPEYVHEEMCLQALEARKHVFVEKVLARNSSEGMRLVKKAREYPKLKTMVGYPLRFVPHFRYIKDFLTAVDIGRPLMAWTNRSQYLKNDSQVFDVYRQQYYSPPEWYFDESKSGGPVFSFASHDFDLLTWYLGAVSTVTCIGDRFLNSGDVMDGYIAILKFRDGAIGHVSSTWLSMVNCSLVSLNFEKATIMLQDSKLVIKEEDKPRYEVHFDSLDMWQAEDRHFIECIMADKTPLTDFSSAVESLCVSEAALESAQTGSEVQVRECR